MFRILIVEKTSVIKEVSIKSFDEKDLYKKAGFKSPEGFEKVHEWTIDGTTVSLYGKTSGRAGQENKYDFPPPVDKVLFFGSCILTSNTNSLNKQQWETIYEKLFGGFEDLDDEDSELSEDDEEDDIAPRTKTGYIKDDFVVDDDDDEDDMEEEDDNEEEDEEDEDDYADEDEVEPKQKAKAFSKPKAKPKAKAKTNKKKANETVFGKIDTFVSTPNEEDENLFLDCTTELVEEEYE